MIYELNRTDIQMMAELIDAVEEAWRSGDEMRPNLRTAAHLYNLRQKLGDMLREAILEPAQNEPDGREREDNAGLFAQ